MAKPIPGAQRSAFASVDFHAHVVDVQDEFGPGFVAHRIPHRSGAKQEETGSPPRRSRFSLEFSGRTWRDDVGRILGPMLDRPRSVLKIGRAHV